MLGHHPGGLQDAQRLVVDRAGPRHRVPRRPALDDRDPPSLAGQQQGGDQPDGSGADDHAVRGRLRASGRSWLASTASASADLASALAWTTRRPDRTDSLDLDLDAVAGVQQPRRGARIADPARACRWPRGHPGRSVKVRLRKASRSGTGKIIWSVRGVLGELSVDPGGDAQTRRPGPAASSDVTRSDTGPLESTFLPIVHWVVSFCARRAVMSLKHP